MYVCMIIKKNYLGITASVFAKHTMGLRVFKWLRNEILKTNIELCQ